MGKRIGYKYKEVCSLDNINRAGIKAAKDKGDHRDVQWYVANRDRLNKKLQSMLLKKEYKISIEDYQILKKQTASGKVREIHKLNYYPFRVAQHAILNVMQERWINSLTNDVYNCLPGHGITSKKLNHNFSHKLKRALLDPYSTYAFKCDIKKFYQSINNKLYSKTYRKELKDRDLIWLLDQHNFSNDGLAIGSPDSQIGSHLMLRGLDRFIKEDLKVKHYFRYADDMLLLGNSKAELHQWMWRIRNYLYYELGLEMKGDRKIIPVTEGIDVCGYVFFPGYTLLRKRIKKAMIKRRKNPQSMASYMGILKHCDGKNLIKKVVTEDNKHMKIDELNITIERPFDGDNIKIDKLVDEEITILDFEVRESVKNHGHKWIRMQVLYNGRKRFVKGGYDYIASYLKKVEERFIPNKESLSQVEVEKLKTKYLPLEDVVIRSNRGYYFEGTLKLI